MTQHKALLSQSQKNKKRLLAVLLSGTILATGMGKTYAEGPSDDADFNENVKHQIALSGGRYTQQQAEMRVLGARSGKLAYPDRSDEKFMKETFETCVQTDYSAGQVPENLKILWENMQFLKNSQTIIGPALADLSVKTDIFYCRIKIGHDLGGLFSKSAGLVGVTSEDASPVDFLFAQIHETTHAVQKMNGVMGKDPSWSLKDAQAAILSYEAAAETAELITFIDVARTLEKESLVPYYKFIQKNMDALKVFKDVRIKGMSYTDAFMETAAVKFRNQFKDQDWLNYYNDDVLEKYTGDMVLGKLTPPSGKTYSLDAARMTGYISPEFNFLAKLDRLPSEEECFGNNKSMRQAFAYVENERLGYTLGRENASYQEGLKKLEKEKNPYLGVDLKEVAGNSVPLISFLQRMNYFASLKKQAVHPASAAKKKGAHP